MKKGEIWLFEFPSSNGHEQAGDRPAIVISASSTANTVVIIPFTTNLQSLRFPSTLAVNQSKENGLIEESVALVFQIRAIDKKRMIKQVGSLESKYLKEIESMMKKLFGF
ncbi:MAG: type II toxin-antitoxin system PemK/MazF family toxin [Candidatus Micrarchaeota archaeon]|nr:type II toxin-antitoxin system PemK/MazF family toxin [Candidatus Micrarchaeota archaeon]